LPSPDSDPNVIYVGTGSDGVRSNVSTGRGVYKTTDGGATWKFAGLYNSGQIGRGPHPSDQSQHRLDLATGDIFKANSERGIFKTTDGGATWKKVLYLSDTLGAMDVEVQPGNPNVVYAWMSRLERKPWTIISGSREGGFYKSTNGGDTFTKTGTGLPAELIGKGQHGGDRGEPESNLRADRSRSGRRHVSIGRCGADVGGVAVAGADDLAAVLLHDDWRRPTNADVVYGGAEGFWKSTGCGQDVGDDAHAARRQSRHLDQSERRQRHDSVERRRRQRLDGRRPHRGPRR
jgi:hypothetical protein